MDFATGSDPALRAALAVGAGAALLSLGLLGGIGALRLRLNARLRRERRFSDLWQPIFSECAFAVPEHVPILAPSDATLFLLYWVRAQESLRGEVQDRLVQLAARTGADRIAVRFLDSGDPRKALLGLVAVGHLRLASAAPLARSLLASPSGVISFAAAQCLARIDPREGMREVLRAAARRDDWPLARLAALLAESDPKQVGAEIAAEIAEGLKRWPPDPGLARLLRLHRTAHPESLRPAVLRALDPPASAEIAAAALEALWHPADLPLARRCASHEEWFVRLAAAKALGRLGGEADRERLAGMLSDPSWWVRYRAAQALARLPGMGAGALRRLGEAATDPYARQMIAHVLSEGPDA